MDTVVERKKKEKKEGEREKVMLSGCDLPSLYSWSQSDWLTEQAKKRVERPVVSILFVSIQLLLCDEIRVNEGVKLNVRLNVFVFVFLTGVRSMGFAYALSPGRERDSALSSIKIGFKECTENLKKIESEFESSIGTIEIEMKGIQGFARICPGDVFEITIKYGEGQKWKSRGKILKNSDQVWDNQSVTFKALIDQVLSIKAVEVRGLGKNVTLGNKLCETRSLFSAHPQLMTVNLNNIGTLKLNLVVTWNPLHGVTGPLFKSQSLLSKSSSSLFGSMRSLPALFSGSSLSGKKSSDRSGTLPVHCRIPVSVTRSDLFSDAFNNSNPSSNSPKYASCQMKKSASANAGITVKSNSDSTSSGSTSSSLHLMGTASSGFGSGSSYCSGSTSVPSSALTSPDCESAPIILSSASRQAFPLHSSPSGSYYFNVNHNSLAALPPPSSHSHQHLHPSTTATDSNRVSGVFNATQFPPGVVGSGPTTGIISGLLSGGTSSFKNNCQPPSRMYLSASVSNLSRGGSGVSSSSSSGCGHTSSHLFDSQRHPRPISQIVEINLDTQAYNNSDHTSRSEISNYSNGNNGCGNKVFLNSVKSRLFERSYNEDILEVADENTDCSSELTDCSPSKGSIGSKSGDQNGGQMMPSSEEEEMLSPAPPQPILPSPDHRRLISASSRSSVYPIASDYINLSDALINLISSLEDIQGQYSETQVLQVNVQNLFKVIKDISAFAATQAKSLSNQDNHHHHGDHYSYEKVTPSNGYTELMINNNNYPYCNISEVQSNGYANGTGGGNNNLNNNNNNSTFIYSNNCKNTSKNNTPCKSSSKLHQRSALGSRRGSFTSDYSFAVESALQSFDFLHTVASDNDSSINDSSHSSHLVDNLSKSTDHLNGSFKNHSSSSSGKGGGKLSHGFSLNLHEQVTSFMTPNTPHTASIVDSGDEDEDENNHQHNHRQQERTIYTPRRSKSSAEHLHFTTGSKQLDLAIIHHISHCQRLLLDLGQFGPLKQRENRSLARLSDQATVMGKLCSLCQHIREYTREINVLHEHGEEGDILRLQAAEGLFLQQLDQQLAFLHEDTRLHNLWHVVTLQHLQDQIDLLSDSSCPLIAITVSQFISSLKSIIGNCLNVNSSGYSTDSLSRNISTGTLSRTSVSSDEIYTKIAHLMTRRILECNFYEGDSIITVFQLYLFFKCQRRLSNGNGKSLDQLLQEYYNEQMILLSLVSNDAIRVKQCLNRYKKNVPPGEPLCQIGLLALQNKDPLIARIAETYFLEARKNKSQRKEVSSSIY